MWIAAGLAPLSVAGWSVHGVAHAEEASIEAALEEPRKAKWEAKRKALDEFGRGKNQFHQKNAAEAIPLLVASLEKQAGCGTCLDYLAHSLIEAERYDDAVRAGRLLMKLFPERSEGTEAVSKAYYEGQQWKEAAAATTEAIGLEPKSSKLWWRRTTALRLAGESDEALRLLDEEAKAAELPAADADCMRIQLLASTGDSVGARGLWESCDETKNLDLQRYSEGWLAMSEGDAELAAKRLMMSGNDSALSRIALAFVRLDQGKVEAALNLVQKAMEKGGGQYWDGRLAEARALRAAGKPAEALAALQEGPLAEGWEAAHAKLDATHMALAARGPDWPEEAMRQASALYIALLVETGDEESAKAAHASIVKVHGEHEAFDQAFEPPAKADEE